MTNVGYPYPNYSWTHNGAELPDTMHTDYGFKSIANISSVAVDAFGNYTLTMTNNQGTYEATFELTLFGNIFK